VTQHYDPLLAKVIAAGPIRSQAVATLSEALTVFQVEGIKTNLPLLLQVLDEDSFATGEIDTGFIDRLQKQRA
jgi:acetyl-CoA carboxylase, biotin carboxylase subunit